MGKTLDERLAARKAGVKPFQAWADAKGVYPELAKFKPDIMPDFKKYDDLIVRYEKEKDQQDKLDDLFDGYKPKDIAAQKTTGDLMKAWQDAKSEYSDDLESLWPLLSSKDQENHLKFATEFANNLETYVKTRKSLWDQIDKTDEALLKEAKSLSSQYKSKYNGIKSNIAKIQSETDQNDSHIRNGILALEKQAIQAKNTKLASYLRTYLAQVG
jgi:hypothetical protein